MKSFAYIVNPITIEQIKNFWPLVKILPDFVVKDTFKNLPPFKIAHIKRLKSISGQEISGFLILCPLLQDLQDLKEEVILDKIIAAGRIAEGIGAKILGLSGYTALITDELNRLAKNLKIPLTSGNAFTGWSVFEAIYRLAKANNVNLKESNLAIIGAANTMGSICAKKLSGYVSRLTLVDRREDKIESIRESILDLSPLDLSPIEVIISGDAQAIVKDADIVVNAHSFLEPPFAIKELKPNAIVCDISLSAHFLKQAKSRRDITVIQAGLVKLPFPANLSINSRLPKDIIYASLAETMLLTFEGKFTNYSLLGETINLDILEDIADLAARHGFEVWVPEAPLR